MFVDVRLGRGPSDRGAVVRALAWHVQFVAGLLALRAAPLAVIDDHRGEPLPAEPFGERCQASDLDGSKSVAHHHRGKRALSLGQVEPGLDIEPGRGRDPHGRAGRRRLLIRIGHVIRIGHDWFSLLLSLGRCAGGGVEMS